ncbi:Uncharacterized protein YwqG [Lentzea fradiae]|uniref:Uncharacterized protein YwqG n=1 Tax=Lentzea fradiae TaxID=200378 RepID=A0A1G7XGX5_9PSEU|nr:DUF1963 domain-containing protein [Lentzea fradiae]SDG83469.1 Uncharacterized protein YwqG [Lentzea fradiae]
MRTDSATDRYEQFRQAATEQGIPKDEIDGFAEHLRFAIYLGGAHPGEEVVGRAGGLPRLPVGVEWPGAGSGYPLPFIASVDYAALPRVEGLPLPADGSLSLFLDHEEDLGRSCHSGEPEFARALYVPAGTETVVGSLPPGHSGMHEEGVPFVLPEYELSARVLGSVPGWMEAEDEDEFEALIESQPESVRQLAEELEHLDELCDVVDNLWPSPKGLHTLHIGGHCQEIGSSSGPWYDMAVENLRNRGGTSGVSSQEEYRLLDEEQYRLSREWTVLAQFLTRDEVYYGCFLIDSADLAVKRFDKMRSFTMFTE